MMFLLSFLTVGNAFIFSDSAQQAKILANSSSKDKDSKQRPFSPEEEKPTRSVSNSLTEEYIHHDHLLVSFNEGDRSSTYCPLHILMPGDDHSSLDCPPPDHS